MANKQKPYPRPGVTRRNLPRQRTHGFRARMATRGGRKILSAFAAQLLLAATSYPMALRRAGVHTGRLARIRRLFETLQHLRAEQPSLRAERAAPDGGTLPASEVSLL